VWWCTPALKRLRQEELKYKASLGYIARPYFKKKEEEEYVLNTYNIIAQNL
jgi:hypothetical protein